MIAREIRARGKPRHRRRNPPLEARLAEALARADDRELAAAE
jgi:hypothetical protein